VSVKLSGGETNSTPVDDAGMDGAGPEPELSPTSVYDPAGVSAALAAGGPLLGGEGGEAVVDGVAGSAAGSRRAGAPLCTMYSTTSSSCSPCSSLL
jgi:hypothetical protein